MDTKVQTNLNEIAKKIILFRDNEIETGTHLYIKGVGIIYSNKYTKVVCGICKSQKNKLTSLSDKDRNSFLINYNLTIEMFDDEHPTNIYVLDSSSHVIKQKCICPCLLNGYMHTSEQGPVGCNHCGVCPEPHTWQYCSFNHNRKSLDIGWTLVVPESVFHIELDRIYQSSHQELYLTSSVS